MTNLFLDCENVSKDCQVGKFVDDTHMLYNKAELVTNQLIYRDSCSSLLFVLWSSLVNQLLSSP